MAVTAVTAVVASFNRPELLSRCLDGLERQRRHGDLDVMVVRDWVGRPAGRELMARFPAVHWLDARRGATVPQLRAAGAHAAQGPVVAFLEDDCVVAANWLPAVLVAHGGTAAAVGGAVEPGPYRRGVDWAIYLCEFAPFMQPLARGPAPSLPGNNVSYKRDRLLKILPRQGDELSEHPLHQALRDAGELLEADPAIEVSNVNSWPRRYALAAPYNHGRVFAAGRVAGGRWWSRFRFAGQALALPLVRPARVARAVAYKRRRVPIVRSTPWILFFEISWAVGEFVGSLFGPGRSAARWR